MDHHLPVKAPSRERYKIEAKNLSYRFPPTYGNFKKLGRQLISDSNNLRSIKSTRYVLRNVNCEAKPGEITAIAGPSGAGKTSLLDILAGIFVPSRVSGQILVNDQPMKPAKFRRVSGYVTQEEALFPHLTVEETLMYSARFRLSSGGYDEAKQTVSRLLKELGLGHVAGVRVGDESSRTLSGGEKRRVSTGVELVHNPAVLLLDEPTSGLDSASAVHVLLLLKSMAKNHGKTVVLTIHQPGFRILELLDRVVLLCNGFALHNGSQYLLEERLKSLGHYPIPYRANLLEFAIEVTDILAESLQIEEEEFDNSVVNNVKEKHSFHSNDPLKEVWILSQRFCRNIFRTKQLFLAKMVQALLNGVLLGTIFQNAYNHPKEAKLQTQLGFFAFSLTFLLSSNTEALPIFLDERRILMRETSRRAYRISSYTIANTIVFLPFLLVLSLIYTVPVYWLVGLRRDFYAFVYYSLLSWMILAMGNSFVAACAALVPDFIVGMSFLGGTIGAFFLFSGYFINKDGLPKFWLFMHYLSLFKYPFECLLINEYGGENGRSKCVQRVDGLCLLYGNELLEIEGIKESQKWFNLAVMAAFILGYRFLCFLILWCRSYRTRS